MAVYVLVCFTGYLRPSEPLRLLTEQLVPPTPGFQYRHWSVVLHPRKGGITGKPQAFDEVLSFDLPCYQFLDVPFSIIKNAGPRTGSSRSRWRRQTSSSSARRRTSGQQS